MCANYRPPDRARLDRIASFRWLVERDFPAEAYPGSPAPMLRRAADGDFQWSVGVFGLVPPWAKDLRFARHTYNARSETVASKPSYRSAWRKGQFCLVPMMAFYEPSYASGKAVRWRIEREDAQVFMVAAIWDAWKGSSSEWTLSFSLLTVNATAHPLMSQFHGPEDEKRSIALADSEWLSAAPADALALLNLPSARAFTSSADPRAARSAAKAV